MGVGGDGHFVIQPPAPLTFAPEKVVNHALDDLALRPGFARDRVFEHGVPLGPRVLLSDRRLRLQSLPARAQSRSDCRTKFAGEGGDRLFDVHVVAVDLLGPK